MARILVVDDSPTIRVLVARMLEFHGHAVTLAENGRDALDQLAIQTPDLILSDVQMPVMDGRALFRAVRAKGLGIPFAGMSGNLPSEEGWEWGFDSFLPKPFTLSELGGLIDAALSIHVQEALVD